MRVWRLTRMGRCGSGSWQDRHCCPGPHAEGLGPGVLARVSQEPPGLPLLPSPLSKTRLCSALRCSLLYRI